MLRQGMAHCRRVKFLTQNRIFHTFLKLEFSMYDNGEYSRLLYTRLSLDNNYQVKRNGVKGGGTIEEQSKIKVVLVPGS